MSQKLSCKLLNVNIDFSEFLLLEIEGFNVCNKMNIGVIYRSPSSNSDNDLNMYKLINSICLDNKNNLILVGDFNWPYTDLNTWS